MQHFGFSTGRPTILISSDPVWPSETTLHFHCGDQWGNTVWGNDHCLVWRHTKHVNSLCGRSEEFLCKVDGTYNTYAMVQSPSWEANWFAASQEIPRISRNPKVHYRTHKYPQPVSILGQPNPVHIPTSHLLEIHPNIIHPSTPRSLQWSLSFRFLHQDPIHPPLLTHTRHMPSPSHSRFYHPHNIGWSVQII